MTQTAQLVILHPGGETFYALERDNVVLGRLESADVVLEDPTVSRVHARVVHMSDVHLIMDLDSRTGTFVNGERVSDFAVELHHGDTVEVGGVKIRYEAPQA